MSGYAVELTATALAAIDRQVEFIAVEKQEPLGAQRWLASVWKAVGSLERFPKRTQLAAENSYKEYEVRQLAVGSQLLLLWVDDDRRKVWIIGLRGSAQRPRPEDLPHSLDELSDDEGRDRDE